MKRIDMWRVSIWSGESIRLVNRESPTTHANTTHAAIYSFSLQPLVKQRLSTMKSYLAANLTIGCNENL